MTELERKNRRIEKIKKNNPQIRDDAEKKVIDTEYLLRKRKKPLIIGIALTVIALLISIGMFFNKDTVVIAVIWLTFVFIAACMCVWGIIIQKKRIRNINEGGFRLVKTRVYDKNYESTSNMDGDPVTYFYLFFENNTQVPYKNKVSVSRKDYNKCRTGDECYLLITVTDSVLLNKVREIFWVDEVIISEELEKFIVYEDEKTA